MGKTTAGQPFPLATESYEIISGRPETGLIILCDHACNAFPVGYGTLGLPAAQLERHIAYDIGAAAVTRAIAAALGATAVLSRYSRLLIDLNRGADDPTLIMRLSDGATVPGNAHMDAIEAERRVQRYWRPYHQAIDWAIARALAAGQVPALFSIHSFTPSWKGTDRPWHASILWDGDPRLPKPVLERLHAIPGLVIGENEPYTGMLEGDCLWHHGTTLGLAHALVEVRQDLIAEPAGQEEWAVRLASVLAGVMADAEVRARIARIEYYCAERKRRALPSLDAFPAMAAPAEALAVFANGQARPSARERSNPTMSKIDQATEIELQAAAFRKLVQHLRQRTDVQNIDLMNLAGFCRNCLSNWYQEAAAEKGVAVSRDEARVHVYGMPYEEWKQKHQKEATTEQTQAFAESHKH